MRRPPRASTWALAGALCGLLAGGVVFAPASWLAAAIAGATGERVLLADARGSVWSGNAVLVLTGGPASRDASALPGRLRWTLGLARENRARLELRLRHACCIGDQLRLRVEFGLGGWRVALPAGRTAVGHWPAAWLIGLGTPWNTVATFGLAAAVQQGLQPWRTCKVAGASRARPSSSWAAWHRVCRPVPRHAGQLPSAAAGAAARG
jgi:general secretion pathway protein N